MLKIGLTGGIGSGKSTVAKFFSELGIEIIDADVIVHELFASNVFVYEKIVEHFGYSVITENETINRKLLREIVFNNSDERKWLEKLLHPIVLQIMQDRSRVIKSSYCILVIPLLFEAKAEFLVDRILVVEASVENQINRLMERDKARQDESKKIIAAQIKSEVRIQQADDVIYNNGSLQDLQEQVLQLHKKYLEISQH